ALTFSKCTNLRVSNLKTLDPQQIHIVIQDCDGVEASNLLVVAPEKSPNTDGIHITRSSNVKVHDSTIGTGDDCISIVSGTKNVEVSNIVCGPGHGISIGSLGVDNSASSVSNVHVTGAVLTGTTNGARIKTWQGGSGYAMNIVYDNIVMKNVSNPIIIDQNYCDKGKDCQKAASGVQIQNVVFSDISGTSATKDAITLDCSESVPCRNIILENVKLSAVKAGPKVDAVCTNINQTLLINTSPTCF
ncbi:Polygalacturonase QRT2, partial [Striga hermonthica]